MSKVGYARVSSVGQSLEVQLEKLNEQQCDRIYQEKISGTTANRPEFKSCMDYLRDGDTLIVTKLDRLARSVVHLAQISKRFEQENINLVVIDQNIDTRTSTGRLMFNMLASIAEFENDLRTERQAEGIAQAKKNGVKFGRKPKLNHELNKKIYARKNSGATVSQLASEFNLGEASIYRAIKAVKYSGDFPQTKTTKVLMWLNIYNNNKFVRGKSVSLKNIENEILPEYDAIKDENEYTLTFHYEDDKDLDEQIDVLIDEIRSEAHLRNGFAEYDFREIGTERTWE